MHLSFLSMTRTNDLCSYELESARRLPTIWSLILRHIGTVNAITTPDLYITAGSKTPFTAGFWTDSGIPAVMWGWHHCRSLKNDTNLQETMLVPGSTRQCPVEQHCRFVVPPDSDGCFKSVGSWLKPAVLSKPTLSVNGSNRQCCCKYQCRFVDQTGSVLVTISVGSWFKPTVLSKTTLSVCF